MQAYLRVVQHVELLGSITAGVQEDSFLASWVVRQELGNIKNLAVDDDPDVVLLVVLGNLSSSV